MTSASIWINRWRVAPCSCTWLAGDLRAVERQQVAVHGSRYALVRVQTERLVQRVNLHLALGGSFDPSSPTVARADLGP